jgi:hypothetical protein
MPRSGRGHARRRKQRDPDAGERDGHEELDDPPDVEQAIAVLALLGFVGRGVHHIVRQLRPPHGAE